MVAIEGARRIDRLTVGSAALHQVDVDDNPNEGAFGWTFLLEAALTATRIRDAARKVRYKNCITFD